MKSQTIKTVFSGMLLSLTLASVAQAHEGFETTTEVFSIEDRYSRLEPVRPIPGDRILPPLCRAYPDLVVSNLLDPLYDHPTHSSIIKAVVKNQGGKAAATFVVRLVVDGSTIREVVVHGLGAGMQTMVTFTVPFWVYNPDAQYEVKADYSNRIKECNEKNNVKAFFGLG
ncbi:CARDB domain-containing protein [Bdellovibrio reynosensis]|uniref:CARDB domain-containing protein n=1 Tax=Bdellovibrio reynosensis TaxID=2835041 RepID=A0ABY4CFS3_9BACT|nr:CARDB domain-containing protein [Bdellovibrio reynosensis]UOF02521.1 hypothetical protein MNR06_06095 [Bdellovibrio reynosensis]